LSGATPQQDAGRGRAGSAKKRRDSEETSRLPCNASLLISPRARRSFEVAVDDVDGSELRATAQRLVTDRIQEIYPLLDQFTANLRRDDVIQVLRTTDLGTVDGSLLGDGIGLVRVTPTGYELVTDSGPLATLAAEVRARASYGQEPTGAYLERHFADPPYGAPVEVVQVLCAAALRAGLLEVIYQGQPIRNPSDARLDQVFTALPRFRSAGFRPPADTGVGLEERVELARKLEQLGHTPPGHSTDALATSVRDVFLPGREAAIRVEAGLGGLGIAAPESVTRTKALLDRLASDDDDDVVTTAHDTWADLVPGQAAVARLDDVLQTHLPELRIAQLEAEKFPQGLPEELRAEHAELRDLLAAGDLDDHAARIIAIARRLAETRRAATAASRRGCRQPSRNSRLSCASNSATMKRRSPRHSGPSRLSPHPTNWLASMRPRWNRESTVRALVPRLRQDSSRSCVPPAASPGSESLIS